MLFFYDTFSTVSSMVNGALPENWLALVQQSEEHRNEVGNHLTQLWGSNEFDPFHDNDNMAEPPPSEFEPIKEK